MEIYCGEPRNSLQIGGTSCWTKTRKDGGWVAHQFWRPIEWWLGLSWRGRWFVGVIRTGEQTRKTVEDDPPGEMSRWSS